MVGGASVIQRVKPPPEILVQVPAALLPIKLPFRASRKQQKAVQELGPLRPIHEIQMDF